MEFTRLMTEDFEQVVLCSDPRVGLRAIIAMHSTVLGPAVGGCRMWNYDSEADAVNDVLRLSRGMTFKASLAGLDWGGGKAVIIGDPKREKTTELLQRYGEFVERLGGNYVTAKDVGIGADDLRTIKSRTRYVLGIEGDIGSSGDPSPATAHGVYEGMVACARKAYGARNLNNLTIAIQGLGSVAYYLLDYLTKDGARVVACDIDPMMIERASRKMAIEIVSPDAIYDVECDIFAPCALGATINRNTVPRIRAKVIAGAANNQLATMDDGAELLRKGVLYAPDYAINAGGLVNIYYEDVIHGTYDADRAKTHVARVGKTIETILDRSLGENIPAQVVADRLAQERIDSARNVSKLERERRSPFHHVEAPSTSLQ